MSEVNCALRDLRHWDLFQHLGDGEKLNVKAFCVFRAHGGTAALLISDRDEVFGVFSELSDVSLLGVSPTDGLLKPEPFHPFKIAALSGKNLQAFSIGVIVGAALDSSGCLYWWGRTSEDQNAFQPPQIAKSKMEPPASFIEICCGHSFMAALSTEGKVYVWGILIRSSFECEELIVDSTVVSVSCGAVHVVMLTSDKEVYTWGSGFDGQRGYSAFTEKDTYTVKKLELYERCSKLICGPVSTLMLLESGDVWACGENSEDFGFLGVNNKMKKIRKPTQVMLDQKKAILIFSTWLSPKPYALYVAVLSDNEVYTWGPHFSPRPLQGGSNLIEVYHNNCTPREMGMIYLDGVDNKEQNLSSSIEVLSISTAFESRPDADPDLLNQTPNCSSPKSFKSSEKVRLLELGSSLLKISAELFGNTLLSDITFVFKNSTFPGHRLFLCSRSECFHQILDLNTPAAANPVMDCSSHDPIAFKGLLQFLYTGHHVVQELPNLLELHGLALFFSEQLLAEDAADKIALLLEPENILSVIAKARGMSSSYLVSKCELYITYLSASKPGVMASLFMNSITH
ncbi:hypothetical protein GE061_019040 [Apolygus lucorum]|uniref:BTB domain-containing protein n=1 Tax=Apolygus lucorum TaxID=248454 RepID=A0A6A4JM21_APOLU|nr:hypothetical protein GE061_019040 [Apolygus lucorum]